jgi:hypothetical protein
MADITQQDARLREVADVAEQQNAKLTSQPEALDRIIRPHVVTGSMYHAYISKDLPLSNLANDDIKLVLLFADTIDMAVYMENEGIITAHIANDIAALMTTWLNSKRAIGGEAAKMISTNKITLEQITEEKTSKTGRFSTIQR